MKDRPPKPTLHSRQHPQLAGRNTKTPKPLIDRKSNGHVTPAGQNAHGKGL